MEKTNKGKLILLSKCAVYYSKDLLKNKQANCQVTYE